MIYITRAVFSMVRGGRGGTLHGKPETMWAEDTKVKVNRVLGRDRQPLVEVSIEGHRGNDDAKTDLFLTVSEATFLMQQLRDAIPPRT